MRGVVFDFDGVIANSEPLHEAALRAAARELGMDFTHEQYLSTYIGFDDRGVLGALARQHGKRLTEHETDSFHERKRRAFLRVVEDGGVTPFPGSVELIRAAADRGPVAVCSGARRHEIEPILDALGVRALMKTIVSADDVALSKPHPESYIRTAERLGVPSKALVAIEDTPAGIESALGAGYRVAAVCHSVPANELTRAHRVFGSMAEVTVGELERV
ncbi:MAG: Phosphorylated carbohydrates phosphatase [Phycisphaerales bacterium]|nr:Phosphorylated carbohydrates phosphatase [Phycisphaerales bacterium]